MNAFAEAGHDVLIVDSISHAWEWVLEYVEKLGRTKYKGNKWSAWSEGTPMQQKLVDAILAYPGHVIATMRSKTEWVTEQNDRGKSAPKRVGTAPRQRDGVEYEFDVLLEMSPEGNTGRFIKDRTGKFQDEIVEKPGEELGGRLAAWLLDGVEPEPAPAEPEPVAADDPEHVKAVNMTRTKIASAHIGDEADFAGRALGGVIVESLDDLSVEQLRTVYKEAAAIVKQEEEEAA